MVSTELTRALKLAAGLVIGLTAIGALLGLLAPGLAGNTPPHPTLTGSDSEALSLLANNARVLAVPFLLALIGLSCTRLGRAAGDMIVAALIASSAVSVGIALGRWRARLIPYLPHLPIEWTALSVAVAAWVLVRDRQPHRAQLLGLGCTAVLLLCAAAALETWATPHAHIRPGRLADARPDSAGARLVGPNSELSPNCRLVVRAPAIDRCTSTTDPQGGL